MRPLLALALLLVGCVVPVDPATTTTPPPPPAAPLTCPQIFACSQACTDDMCQRGCWDQAAPGERERAMAVSQCAGANGCTDQACVSARCGTEIQTCHAVAAATPLGPAPPPPGAAQPSPGLAAASLVGKWGHGASTYGVVKGIDRRQYDFGADGRYVHRIESFAYTAEVTVITERGTWSIAGELLTIAPTATEGVVAARATGQVLRTFAVPLEPTTYRFRRHFFSGLNETQLVLQPPAPTARDGAPATNPDFPGAYLLSSTWVPEWIVPPR